MEKKGDKDCMVREGERNPPPQKKKLKSWNVPVETTVCKKKGRLWSDWKQHGARRGGYMPFFNITYIDGYLYLSTKWKGRGGGGGPLIPPLWAALVRNEDEMDRLGLEWIYPANHFYCPPSRKHDQQKTKQKTLDTFNIFICRIHSWKPLTFNIFICRIHSWKPLTFNIFINPFLV